MNFKTSSVKNKKKNKSKRILKPSERYPEAKVVEEDIDFEKVPSCEVCHKEMSDSGLSEDSEYLEKIPLVRTIKVFTPIGQSFCKSSH